MISMKDLDKWSIFEPKPVSDQTTTIALEIEEKSLKLKNDIDFTLYDFAGQLEYSTTHQVFFLIKHLISLIFYFLKVFLF